MQPRPRPPGHAAALANERTVFWGGVAIVALVLIAYANSLSGALVLDDLTAVTTNPTIRRLWPLRAVLSPPADSGVGGRPLANLTFAMNYAVSGTSVWSYHAVNVALHALGALVLFGVIRRTVSQAGRTDADGARIVWASATAAALWTVHPLTTATVTYISQRTELLMGLFYLLTLYAFVRGAARPSRLWLTLSVAACAVGMACKEVMATAPVVVLLYDRAFVAGSFGAALRQRRGYYAGLAATWLVLAGLMTTGLAQRGVGLGLGVSWSDYALTESYAVCRYAGLAVWPCPLIFDYGPVFMRQFAEAAPYLAALALAVAGTMFALWRRPRVGFPAAAFLLVLAPTSSVIPVATQPIAENRAYLPLAALLAGGICGLTTLVGRRGWWCGAALALGLTALTVRRNLDYRSETGLWADTVAKRPENPRAHNNLGYLQFQAGDTTSAIAHYETALALSPDYPEAHNNLGNALRSTGRVAEAMSHFQRALALKPGYFEAGNNAVALLFQLGRTGEATELYASLLHANPERADAHNNFGVMLRRAGRTAEALAHYERAVQLQPDLADAHYNWGNALVELGRLDEAAAHFESARRLRPDHAETHYNLGNVCFQLGRLPEAIACYEAALRLRADSAEYRNNYGSALFRVGRNAEAIAQFQEALRLQPDYAVAQANLARALGAAAGK